MPGSLRLWRCVCVLQWRALLSGCRLCWLQEQTLDAKVIIFHKRRRKNSRNTKGHRQVTDSGSEDADCRSRCAVIMTNHPYVLLRSCVYAGANCAAHPGHRSHGTGLPCCRVVDRYLIGRPSLHRTPSPGTVTCQSGAQRREDGSLPLEHLGRLACCQASQHCWTASCLQLGAMLQSGTLLSVRSLLS